MSSAGYFFSKKIEFLKKNNINFSEKIRCVEVNDVHLLRHWLGLFMEKICIPYFEEFYFFCTEKPFLSIYD